MSETWQIPGFLESENNELHIDGVPAKKLTDEFGTPLFVFSAPRIRHNIDRLRRAQERIDCRLKICYAAKANSNMAILGVVRDAECDLEVNSGGELWKAIQAGFKGDQIIFNGNSKEIWEIESAIENGIFAIQVDSLFELDLIVETARRLGKTANVSLRMVPEIESKTHSGLQTAMLTSKFGMMPYEAVAAFVKFKDEKHLRLRGVHLHIGSQNSESEPYALALDALFKTLIEIHDKTGIKPDHLNLGGGFPVNYLRDRSHAEDFPSKQRKMFEAGYEPADVIERAWKVIKDHAEDSGCSHLLEGLTLLLEPGRSIIADTGICLTSVRNVKSRPLEDESRAGVNSDEWLLTDAGFNLLLSMETYKWYYHAISAERSSTPHETFYKVAGPLCDGGDVYFDIEGEGRLPERRRLPENVQPGEVLALLNCGAYSIAQMFPYNGRFLPAVVLTEGDGKYRLIRKRDRFEDLLLNDVF
jgi:D-ornithine/D-lysine decarboxylase